MDALKRVFVIRLYPSVAQSEALQHALHVTCRLYNAALQQRRDAWRLRRENVARMQRRDLTSLRAELKWVRFIYRECLDATLQRLDLAFMAFFRRLRTPGQKAGFPRFKKTRRWRQLTFPHGDRALRFNERQAKLYVPMAGWIRVRKGRVVPQTYGRAWLVRKGGKWYGYFECKVERQPLPATGTRRGYDRGVRVLTADSDGNLTRNPEIFERFRLRIERWQRAAARRKKGSNRRRGAASVLSRIFERLANARRDHAHKISRGIVETCDFIALENLRLSNMTASAKGNIDNPGVNVKAKSGLNRVVLDAGFGQLARLIVEKAESAVRTVVFVDPAGTSQVCSRCDHIDARSRHGPVYRCINCAFEVDADVNAARNILRRAELSACGEARSGGRRRGPAKCVTAGADPRLTQEDVA